MISLGGTGAIELKQQLFCSARLTSYQNPREFCTACQHPPHPSPPKSKLNHNIKVEKLRKQLTSLCANFQRYQNRFQGLLSLPQSHPGTHQQSTTLTHSQTPIFITTKMEVYEEVCFMLCFHTPIKHFLNPVKSTKPRQVI